MTAGFATQATSASISPCGDLFNKWDGADKAATLYGAAADIEAYAPALCDAATGSPSMSSAWSMVSGYNDNLYAQVGYAKFGSNSPSAYHWAVFTEWTPASGPFVRKFWASPPPASTRYQVGYSFTDTRINMWEGTTQLTHTNYDPASVWDQPWDASFYGETWGCNSDVPGTSSNKVTFSNIEKKLSNGTWDQIPYLVLNAPDCDTRFHNEWVTSPTSFSIWTDPLN